MPLFEVDILLFWLSKLYLICSGVFLVVPLLLLFVCFLAIVVLRYHVESSPSTGPCRSLTPIIAIRVGGIVIIIVIVVAVVIVVVQVGY